MRLDNTSRSIPRLEIRPAQPGDAPAIGVLLREAGLPDNDFGAHLAHFLVARDDRGVVVAAAGAEVLARHALLRSVVVAEARRGAGIGDELLRRMDEAADGWGVERWWLLTTTAEKFFGARGFVEVSRAEAPASIQQTYQFTGGCCRSAVCMTRALKSVA
jgi:amino-acid N-acetyltransferase